jgi:ATPase subunit of ABC transporter with duplicated ATPase domains
MMSDKKTYDVGHLTDNETLKDNVLTLAESSAYTGVSTRTIERHATFTKYQPESITRNSRKTKGFLKSWLDKQFKDVGQMSDSNTTSPTSVGQMSDKLNNTENEAIKEVSLIDELKQDVTFLRKEIKAKNDQLQAKDNQIIELISSEQKTKMLLADLQLQQKNLLLDKPSAKQWEKKSNKIWWALFFLLAAVCGVVLYFGITIVQDFFNKLISNF